MGGKKAGGGARTPYEAPNTLSSAQTLRIVDVISEGVVSGFANGDDAPFKSVFFNDTPVQNSDGTYNFKGVTAWFQRGTPDQSYIPGWETTERTVAVSTAVKNTSPVVRTVSDNGLNRLRVTVGVERNVSIQDNGDTLPAHTVLMVAIVNNDGVHEQRIVNFTEKGSGAFYHDEVFENLPSAPYSIKVTRQTPDSQTDKVQNGTFFASYVEITDAKLCYPHTALVALSVDSDQFGGSAPRRNYLIKGKEVQVPSNYDPEARTYAGLWDGSFKMAWTNNPAWVFYDLLTQPRYSTLARRLRPEDIDKWALYQVARYCDEKVPDGFGGQEPRFVCNVYLTDQRQAGEVLTDIASAFCGMPIWNGNQVSVVLDQNQDPVAQYDNSNVVDGLFAYSGSALKATHTAVHVRYADKYDSYRSKTEYVADNEAIKRYGLNIKSVTAFGCDSRGQAVRAGQWILQTGLRQQNTVSFTVGREGLRHLPYDIIQVADNQYAGLRLGGRVIDVNDKLLTVDFPITENLTDWRLQYIGFENDADGRPVPKQYHIKVVSQPKPNQILLESAPQLAAGDNWALTGKVRPRLYRAISIKENTEEGTYTITALLHDPSKYETVDRSALFAPGATTVYNTTPQIGNGNLSSTNRDITISWDNLSADGQIVSYDIKIFKDGRLWRHIPDAPNAEIKLEGLPNGEYRTEIRGRTARGQLTAPLEKAWTLTYALTGVRTTPKLFAIDLSWNLPNPLLVTAHTEIRYAEENNRAKSSLLAKVPAPQNTFALTDVKVGERWYFWLRLTDAAGVSGEWTDVVEGTCTDNPALLLEQLKGKLGKEQFAPGAGEELLNLVGNLAGNNNGMAGNTGKLAGKWDFYSQMNEADYVLSKRINAVRSQFGDKIATVAEEMKTLTTRTEAQARKVQAVESEVAGAKASVTQVAQSFADLNGKLSAAYTLKVSTDTRTGTKVVGGISLLADGTSGQSEVVIQADKLVLWNNKKLPMFTVTGDKTYFNGDLIADGSILGRHIKANQTIEAPDIRGGTLHMADGRFIVTKEHGAQLRSDPNSKVGTQVDYRGLIVRNEKGHVMVRVGRLTNWGDD